MNDPRPSEITKGPRRRDAPHAGWLLVALAVYVLSPPIIELVLPPHGPAWDAAEAFYAPLSWAYDSFPPVEAFYDFYSELS